MDNFIYALFIFGLAGSILDALFLYFTSCKVTQTKNSYSTSGCACVHCHLSGLYFLSQQREQSNNVKPNIFQNMLPGNCVVSAAICLSMLLWTDDAVDQQVSQLHCYRQKMHFSTLPLFYPVCRQKLSPQLLDSFHSFGLTQPCHMNQFSSFAAQMTIF